MVEIGLEFKGTTDVKRGVEAMTKAMRPAVARRNFNRVLRFAQAEIKKRTPGSGKLREAWVVRSSFKASKDGWSFTGAVANRRADQRLFYTSAHDGKRRLKRKADDSPQRYRDIIPILDKGSKPHIILPRRYKFLIFAVKNPLVHFDPGSTTGFRTSRGRFASEKDQTTTVYTKKVRHPGTKPYKLLSTPRKLLANLARAAVEETRGTIISAWTRKKIKVVGGVGAQIASSQARGIVGGGG